MIQQLLALIIIAYIIIRTIWQKKNQKINSIEFFFWISFWLIAGFAVIFIKYIDRFVAELGFSGSGINILFYLAVIVIFYLIFKLRIKIEKIESNITRLTREISLKINEK